MGGSSLTGLILADKPPWKTGLATTVHLLLKCEAVAVIPSVQGGNSNVQYALLVLSVDCSTS